MQKGIKGFSYVFILSAICVAFAQERPSPSPLQTVAPIMWQNSMNTFRRFAADPKVMFDFYGGVLGLKQLETYSIDANTRVARFQAGASELKLTAKVPNRRYQPGGVPDATGIRLITLYFPDQQSLVQRFRAHGLPVPEFRPTPDSNRTSALVKDPDGQWLELVVVPNAPAEVYQQIEIGVTVSDLAASRKFYREFVGLEELAPVDDPIFHVKKYPFRHGSTTINLRSFGKPLPRDTGSGGIQYVVTDAQAVEALAKARQVTIDQPLSTLPNFSLRTIWLEDPDGITNYFAETSASRQPRTK